ncbi:4'-phosphopantetheinyl transferase family protein [Montanilutibacter psychrotolerans]|uniref:4'-phosphopantetheinyl transferase family protein n=1 Tax=Montanilutibacter psychrotolerans TaxID=1327343 RepID=UPI0016808D56|nr:4'-phosphopantetheinyl transferase superfamily protein [Lysobacter psychrotolerans]
MDTQFEGVLSSSRWRAAASLSVFVGLFELRDWQAWVDDAYAVLDATESGRVRSRRSPTRRDQLALCYALHRLVLGRALHCDVASVPIGRDRAGCPRVAGGSLATSLSHADGCLAVAVSAAGPVGVDIESLARAAVMPEIVERLCHPADRAAMEALAEDERNQALLALWVRKEAFLKAIGIGLQREMQTFAAPDDAVLPRRGGVTSQVRMLDAGPHWVAAVAKPPGASVECVWLRPNGATAQQWY